MEPTRYTEGVSIKNPGDELGVTRVADTCLGGADTMQPTADDHLDQGQPPAHDVRCYFSQVHNLSISQSEAENFADELQRRGVDPLDYLHGRESSCGQTSIYDRLRRWQQLKKALLEDAGVPQGEQSSDLDEDTRQKVEAEQHASRGVSDGGYPHHRDWRHKWPPQSYRPAKGWGDAKKQLREWCSDREYLDFLDDLCCVRVRDSYHVIAKAPFQASYVDERHADLIRRALRDHTDADDVDVTIRPPVAKGGSDAAA